MTDGYLAFLRARDGDADLLRHTLSRREAFFDRLAREPVRSRRAVDRETFLRNLARRRPEPGLDDRMLWLLATAKANQAERFGVGLSELYGKVNPDDPILVRIVLQEHYHTRILADAVAIFGLPVRVGPPALAARIRLLYDEILGDEIGHVGYVASLLGPAGRTLMRGLHRVLGLQLAYEMPELVAVLGRDEIARRFRAEFRVDEMAAELPGRAYAAATI